MTTDRTLEGIPNWENRTLFHGDNLDFLRSINSNTVQLIATDPPFNKSKDFHATPDSLSSGAKFKDRWRWDKDIHDEWVDQIQDDWPATWAVIESTKQSYGSDMAAFLCWLGVRLMEMRRILCSDGSIYLHIDHTAHAYVKALMDSVFGRRQFVNEIIWSYRSGGGSKRHFGRKHDILLFYTKGIEWTFNADDVRVPYDAVIAKKRAHLFNERGKISSDVWDISRPPNHSPELTGYPTQKPLAVYERILKASSNPGDIVLDPFCGCATTPIAAERLGRQWVGMDIWDGAYDMVLDRLVKEGLAVPEQTSASERFITFGDVHLRTVAPERTDENDTAAPTLRLRSTRPTEPWQRLPNKVVRRLLADAQSSGEGLVDCAGCGRSLEIEFFDLDHIMPKAEGIMPKAEGGENFITNRVLLCSPCNKRKSDQLTLRGLITENKSKRWMENPTRASNALAEAKETAAEVRDDWESDYIQEKIRRASERQ